MGRDDAAIITCYRCGALKAAEEFAWRRKAKGQRDSFCRPCRAAYRREHYERNRQRYIDRAAVVKQRQRLRNTTLVLAYFDAHPCRDCGETDPVVLDFDHLRDKSFNIASTIHDRPWKAIEAEIAKCDVVCSNCHRRRTARRRGSLRFLLRDEPE